MKTATVHELRPAAGPKRRVLVVEDNLDSVHSMAALVRMMGHEVEFAINGFAALDVARKFRPDVVLLDIGLPDINGYEVARQVRALPGVRQPRLIALTGWGQEQDRRQSREAGFDAHMVKPVDPDELARTLAELTA